MKKLLITVLIFTSFHAISKEQWFCTDDQAMREGSTLSICGIGNLNNEGGARQIAFERAIIEFHMICDLSSDCKGHKIIVDPKRSSCFKENGGYICHRMFTFTIEK